MSEAAGEAEKGETPEKPAEAKPKVPRNEGAQPGDQQQAQFAETGTARPEYDQYEINQPGNLNKKGEERRKQGGAD